MATTGKEPPTRAWVTTSLSQLQLRRLHDAFDSPKADLEDPLVRLARAELAMRGEGPPSDAVVCARRALREGWPDAARYVAAAVRALVSAGAVRLAEDLLAKAGPTAESDEVRLAKRQLEERVSTGRSSEAFEVALARRGAASSGEALLEAVTQSSAERDERRSALAELAKLARRRRDFAKARTWMSAAHGLAPEADDAAFLQFTEAKDAWAAGDRDRALELLKAVRDQQGDASPARQRADMTAELLEPLEKDPAATETGPRWTWSALSPKTAEHGDGRGVLLALPDELRPAGLAVPEEVMPTMAHIVHALRRGGVETMRVALDVDVASACLAAGAVLVLEEERPTRRGFRFVVGVEPLAKLFAAHDADEWGPELVGRKTQERRGALFGQSALVVLGDGDAARARRKALDAAHVTTSSELETLDACDLDEDGRRPPRARVFQLTRKLLEKSVDSQPARRRLGEELLVAWRSDDVKVEEVMLWYAEARERFPHAEWPAQIYGQILEARRFAAEAGIAYAQAGRADPYDWRNQLGEGRALWTMGRTHDADARFRRGAALVPDLDLAYMWMARTALWHKDLDTAEVCAEIDRELDPKNPTGLSILANVLELRGEGALGLAALEEVLRITPEDLFAVARVARGHARAGRLDAGRQALAAHVKDAPRAADSEASTGLHEHAARLAWTSGNGDDAWATIVLAIQRFGALDALLGEAVRIASSSFPADLEAAKLGELAALCPAEPNPLTSLLAHAIERRLDEHAVALADKVCATLRDDGNREWFPARTRLHTGRGAAEHAPIRDLLSKVIEKSTGFEAGRLYLAAHISKHDPDKALEVLRVDGSYHVAGLWELQAQLLAARGDTAGAETLHRRLASLPAEAFGRTISYVRRAGFASLSRALVSAAREQHPNDWSILIEWMRELLAAGQTAEAAEALRYARSKHPAGSLAWGICVEVAAAAADWELLRTIAKEQIESLRDTRNIGDVWIQRALLAGAELGQGRGEERERLLATVPKHADALSILVAIERKLGHAYAAEDEARLRAFAEGSARRLSRKEVFPWNVIT